MNLWHDWGCFCDQTLASCGQYSKYSSNLFSLHEFRFNSHCMSNTKGFSIDFFAHANRVAFICISITRRVASSCSQDGLSPESAKRVPDRSQESCSDISTQFAKIRQSCQLVSIFNLTLLPLQLFSKGEGDSIFPYQSLGTNVFKLYIYKLLK